MIKGVIFDMDGVLVDNADIHVEAFDIYCKSLNTELDVSVLMPLFGMGNDEIMPRIFPPEIMEGRDPIAMGIEKEAIYRGIFAEKVAPTRGLTSFLNDLRSAGIKTAVGSSGTKLNVDFVLDKCGISDKFDAVVNGEMVSRCKPAPDIYLLACKLLGLEPSECLVFEDAHQGIIAARTAGCNAIGLSTTFSRPEVLSWDPDMVISDFEHINLRVIEDLYKSK